MYSLLKPVNSWRYAAPAYDLHAFAGQRPRPVSAGTGIAWEDYARMAVQSHKQRAERRLPTPLWALDNSKLLPLFVRSMERRAALRPGTGTFSERLDRAVAARKRQIPALERTLRRLCKRYTRRRSANCRRRLALQIQALDASICLIKKGETAAICAAVYLYYRAELDSVGVAEAVGIRPPAVRQILWKISKLWEREFASDTPALPDSLSDRPSANPVL